MTTAVLLALAAAVVLLLLAAAWRLLRPRRDPYVAETVTPTKKAMPASCQVWGDAVGGLNRDVPRGVQRRNVRATYHNYSPAYLTANLACADHFWSRWSEDFRRGLLKYPWTAACLSKPFSAKATCGKCLRVTNRRTGTSVVVRAVDYGGCSDADGTGLDMDPCAFDAIDTDKRGYADGNMRVDVTEVEC